MTERIPPIPPHERVGEIAELLGTCQGEGALQAAYRDRPPLNVQATLVRNPALFRPCTAYAQYLTNGLLSARDRELAVLRTAVRCRSPYEWAHHYQAAIAAGVSAAEVDDLGKGIGDWDPHEQALLDAVDQLHTASTITDETWRLLHAHYSEAELIELVMLVGQYHAVAYLLNTMGTQADEWLPPTPPLPS
ncbi:MAG TPA: carboxymuconolactone decarboxylase family protein [Pseudonocardiaceae bacterium]|jgi:alkylhydroperoxidase family enzyme|nr:carboxymuconolactone decarboxylase family protein [Pseudonocardiaceae bacterium]